MRIRETIVRTTCDFTDKVLNSDEAQTIIVTVENKTTGIVQKFKWDTDGNGANRIARALKPIVKFAQRFGA